MLAINSFASENTHVAIAAEWIKKSALNKGDVVEIFPQPNGNLLLRPFSNIDSKQGKEIEIDISKTVDINLVMRLVLSKYLSGYRIIKIYDVEGIDLEVRSQVGQLVANLMGVEIIDESDHWLTLKDLSSLQSLDLNQLIRRTHVLSDKMFSSSIDAFLNTLTFPMSFWNYFICNYKNHCTSSKSHTKS